MKSKFNYEQRTKIILEWKQGKPIEEVAKKYGISDKAIYRWQSLMNIRLANGKVEANPAPLLKQRKQQRKPTRLTVTAQKEIARRMKGGEKSEALAKEYGIDRSSVYNYARKYKRVHVLKSSDQVFPKQKLNGHAGNGVLREFIINKMINNFRASLEKSDDAKLIKLSQEIL